MPTTDTKLYIREGAADWKPENAELFREVVRKTIIAAFEASLEATGFKPE